ncbi:MAG: M56 family metallopeptidase [Planctomycetota bacterium]
MIDWQSLMDHPLTLTTGWAVLHAVWVGVLLAVGLWGALWLMPERPITRYYASAATLLGTPAVVALVLVFQQPWSFAPDRAPFDHTTSDAVVADTRVDDALPSEYIPLNLEPVPDTNTPTQAVSEPAEDQATASEAGPSRASDPFAGLHEALPYAAVLYLVGLVVMALRLAGGWCLTLRLRTSGLSPLPSAVARLAERSRRASGVRRAVRFAVSSRAAVPCVVGVLRPVVLLPASAVMGLTPIQLSAVLAHELAHVRRHDVLINLLQVLIETLLFFHPAVWWVGRTLRHERECCCDEAAVVSVGDRVVYADALAAIAQSLPVGPSLSLSATDGGLAARVRRLLTPSESAGRQGLWGVGLLVVLLLGAVLTVVACGQAASDEADTAETDNAQTLVDLSVNDDQAASDEPPDPHEPVGPRQARVLEIDFQKLKAGDLRYNVVIRPGDIISVPPTNAGFVYIMGSIARPGAYTIPGEQELTLNRLIASAGGFADRPEPEPGKVWIVDLIRQVNDTDQDIYRASLQGVRDGSEADIYLRINDVINIHQATMQEVLDFEQPDWVQAQLKQEHPAGVRPILTQELTRPKLPGLSPITEADLTPMDEPYVMAEGDTVQVSIYELRIPGRDDVQQRRIDQNGYVRLAIVGPVKAAGRTTTQLEEEIARILDENGIMRDATVRVQMLDARANTFTFLHQNSGSGARPGTYIIPKRNFRLIEAITIAGGIPDRSQYLYVIRNSVSRAELSGKPSDKLPSPGVKPGSEPGAVPSAVIEDEAVAPLSDRRQVVEQLVAKLGELGKALENEDNSDEAWGPISEALEDAERIVGLLESNAATTRFQDLFAQLKAIDGDNLESIRTKARPILKAMADIGPSIPGLIEKEGMTPDDHLKELASTYRLKEGEDLRVIYPPFAAQRGVYADAEYPYAKGSDNIKSMGFWWDGKKLDNSYMSYASETSEDILAGSSLRLPWYQLEHLDRLDWDPGVSDWVARKGMPIEQTLDAFAKVYAEQTGRPIRFEKRTVTRPCVFHDSMKGEKLIFPPVKPREFRKVMLTVDRLSDEELAQWKKKCPDDATHRFSAKRAGQAIDTPILSGVLIWMDERTRTSPGVFYIGAGAQRLSHTDAGYREKLKKIVGNMQAQVGGEWRIEDRTFDVWRPVVDGGGE